MPAASTSPWGKALDALMADGCWRTLDALVAEAGHLVPPGRAWRQGEARQERHRTTGTGRPRTSDDARVRVGRRSTIAATAHSRVQRGRWETRVTAAGREWRRVS